MKTDLKPGVYVIAVSGGVDSMVLLDLMAKQAKSQKLKAKSQPTYHLPPTTYHLVVAHYDHGIREDSEQDRLLVQKAAEQYDLPFVYDKGNLGRDTSEATARTARYKFLRRIKKVAKADAIVTAHHQDDLLETAVLNLLRGTGRKGLSSLASNRELCRPLLHIPKSELKEYAKTKGLTWREDETNKDLKYRRNYVRANIITKLSPAQRKELIGLLGSTKKTNQEIDVLVIDLLRATSQGKTLSRQMFINLSHAVALELMAAWMRRNGIRQFDKKLLEKLVAAAKTLAPGKQTDIYGKHIMRISKEKLTLTSLKQAIYK